jgi:hypothetical protein
MRRLRARLKSCVRTSKRLWDTSTGMDYRLEKLNERELPQADYTLLLGIHMHCTALLLSTASLLRRDDPLLWRSGGCGYEIHFRRGGHSIRHLKTCLLLFVRLPPKDIYRSVPEAALAWLTGRGADVRPDVRSTAPCILLVDEWRTFELSSFYDQ